MELLFFDIECSNGRDICEFGYVITDEKFKLIKREVITITFENANKMFTKDTIVGNPVEKPLTPYNEGKLFKGWYLENSKYDFNEPVTTKLTLTAKWEEVTNLENISIYHKAEIRKASKEKKQGLIYHAIINESYASNEHGFYLVYGMTTQEDLVAAISNDGTINGKKVFKVVVKGVTDSNTYSVILTGIPETAFDDVITAIPYIRADGTTIIAKEFHLSTVNQALEFEQAANLKNEQLVFYFERRKTFVKK